MLIDEIPKVNIAIIRDDSEKSLHLKVVKSTPKKQLCYNMDKHQKTGRVLC